MTISYRTIIEVLRFVAPKEVLGAASDLNILWNKAASSSELWWDLCELYDIVPFRTQVSGKEAFKEGCWEFPISELPLVRPSTIVRYSIPNLTETTVQLSVSVIADQFTAYCYLSRDLLLICGGGGMYVSNAYAINLGSGLVTELAHMKQGRRSHAVYKYRNSVYVFGGYMGRNLDSIEKYSRKEDEWELLSGHLAYPMEAFVPARYKQDIYLVGARYIEVFDLQSETCRPFALSLPETWFYCLTSISKEGEMIIAQKNNIISCSLPANPPVFTSIQITKIGNGNYWSPGTPVKHEQAVYSFQNSHGTIEGVLKMDRNSLSKVGDIQY